MQILPSYSGIPNGKFCKRIGVLHSLPIQTCAVMAVLLFFIACKEDTGSCAIDDDCEKGSICDFISGNCYPSNVEFTNGLFTGDFSCVVGADYLSAPIGTSHIYGGWQDAALSFEYLPVCYIDSTTDNFVLALAGRRVEDGTAYNYIVEMWTRTATLTGDVQIDLGSASNPPIGEASTHFLRAIFQNNVSLEGDQAGAVQSGSWHLVGEAIEGETVNGSVNVVFLGTGAGSEFATQCIPNLFQGGYDICQAQTETTYGDVISYSWSDGATNSSSSLIFRFNLWQDEGAPDSPGQYTFNSLDENPQSCAACLSIEDYTTNTLYGPKAGGTYELTSVYPAADAVGQHFTAAIDAELQAIDSSSGNPISDGCTGNLFIQLDVPIEAP